MAALAGLRSLYAYQWSHPGKQLLFMGQEIGQEQEWNESYSLDWWLLDQEIGDNENPWKSGYFMGFQQTKDGALTWGYGQNYCKYDLIGRKVYDRLCRRVIRISRIPLTTHRTDIPSCASVLQTTAVPTADAFIPFATLS